LVTAAGVQYVPIDVDEEQRLAVQMGIQGFPTTLFVCNKKEVKTRVVGFQASQVAAIQQSVDDLVRQCQRTMKVKNSKIQHGMLQDIESMPELNGRVVTRRDEIPGEDKSTVQILDTFRVLRVNVSKLRGPTEAIKFGDICEIQDMKSEPALNGRQAKIISKQVGGLNVQLEKTSKSSMTSASQDAPTASDSQAAASVSQAGEHETSKQDHEERTADTTETKAMQIKVKRENLSSFAKVCDGELCQMLEDVKLEIQEGYDMVLQGLKTQPGLNGKWVKIVTIPEDPNIEVARYTVEMEDEQHTIRK